MVAAALAGFVLLGVLTTNVQLMRSGLRITHYAEMESQARRSLEQFGRDVRIASGIKWNTPSDITLTIPTIGGGTGDTTAQVTYAWSAASATFFLVPGADSTVATGRIDLVRGIPRLADGNAGLTFVRFDRDGNAATTDLATKRIQVTMTLSREARTMAAATENVVSATFTMRNKAVQ